MLVIKACWEYINVMNASEWNIYLGEIPHSRAGNFWVSFESDPALKKTKANIYGRCLPCIENLYQQLQDGRNKITLGNANNCWKITAIVPDIDTCINLLAVFEKYSPRGHVYGKFGSSRPDADTRAVVFHTETVAERDRVRNILTKCLPEVNANGNILISRACAVLYEPILGDWKDWQSVSPIKYPENINKHIESLKKIIHTSRM